MLFKPARICRLLQKHFVKTHVTTFCIGRASAVDCHLLPMVFDNHSEVRKYMEPDFIKKKGGESELCAGK